VTGTRVVGRNIHTVVVVPVNVGVGNTIVIVEHVGMNVVITIVIIERAGVMVNIIIATAVMVVITVIGNGDIDTNHNRKVFIASAIDTSHIYHHFNLKIVSNKTCYYVTFSVE